MKGCLLTRSVTLNRTLIGYSSNRKFERIIAGQNYCIIFANKKRVSIPQDVYLTIADPAKGVYKEKGSKFMAFAFPVETEEEVKNLVDMLKKEYYDARHHCYAYILGYKKEKYRENDDGEPSGTAGKPIHGQLLSKGLTNTLVVVVRYFGGTKLGVSGLIQAYKTAAQDALNHATVIEKIIHVSYCLTFHYPEMNDVMRIMKEHHLEQDALRMEETCHLIFSVRISEEEKMVGLFSKIEGLLIRKQDG